MKVSKDIGNEELGIGGIKKKMDVYQFFEVVDIFKKLNQKWSELVFKEEKWSEKVKLM